MRCKSPSNFTVILIHSSYLISLISQFKLVVFAALTRLVGFFCLSYLEEPFDSESHLNHSLSPMFTQLKVTIISLVQIL